MASSGRSANSRDSGRNVKTIAHRTLARLVQIEWVDSRQPTAAWRRVSDLDYLSECRCTSVGFLLRDDDRVKVLAVSIADEGDEMQATGVYVIPTAAVLSFRRLHRPPHV
jgi:hypothetical protein